MILGFCILFTAVYMSSFLKNLGLISLTIAGSFLYTFHAYATDVNELVEACEEIANLQGRMSPLHLLDQAQRGDIRAQTNLAYVCHKQGNHTQGFLYTKDSANKGDPYALYNLAAMYFHGNRVPQDYQKAASYYEDALKAAVKEKDVTVFSESLSALKGLGQMYCQGEIVKKDDAKALYYWKIAGDHGALDALHNVALLYEDCNDDKNAISCFQKAAAGGFLPSQYELAYKYFEDKKYDKAWVYFQRVIDHGKEKEQARYYRNACYTLGEMYQNGRGVIADKNMSLIYYARAASLGDEKAINALQSIDLFVHPAAFVRK